MTFSAEELQTVQVLPADNNRISLVKTDKEHRDEFANYTKAVEIS